MKAQAERMSHHRQHAELMARLDKITAARDLQKLREKTKQLRRLARELRRLRYGKERIMAQKLKAFWCEGTGPYASAFAVVLAGDKVEACDLAKVHHRADFFGISFHPDAVEEMPLLPLNGMSAKILVWGDHADC